jgi:hypothetical protein
MQMYRSLSLKYQAVAGELGRKIMRIAAHTAEKAPRTMKRRRH